MDKSNCTGCGALLDLEPGEASRAVETLLESTRTDNRALGRVCPLCGHPTNVPFLHRRSVHLGLLLVILVVAALPFVVSYTSRDTQRRQAVHEALVQLHANPDVVRYLGTPLTIPGDIVGRVKEDETGWQEVRLTMPLRGSRADGFARVVGGRQGGPWKFTTLEVVVAPARKRVDLISGRVVDYDREGFVEAHTQAAIAAEYIRTEVPPATRSAEFPCISMRVGLGQTPRTGTCAPRFPIVALTSGPVDEFLLDLRYGKFTLRQTDLTISDGALEVPFTRTYTSEFWTHSSRANAFGVHSTHDFDAAPIGSRNPYTYLMIVLADGDFLYFPRISRGSGYSDAVYQHSETASPFHGAVLRWTGEGWATTLRDGSLIHFPESYHARNMAQGAADVMVDATGRTLRLLRDRQRNLQMIETPQHRRITLTLDEQGRIVRAEGDTRERVEYHYDSSGRLAEVHYADGRGRRYTYDGTLLTRVQDETGHILVENAYRKGRVVEQTYPNQVIYRIRYDMSFDGPYARSATVETPTGTTLPVQTEPFVPDWIRKRE